MAQELSCEAFTFAMDQELRGLLQVFYATRVAGHGAVSITLDRSVPWKADPLAAGGGGRIVLLMRDPAIMLFEADVMIGPAYPTTDNDYSAEITGSLTQAEFDLFVGGTMTVGGLTARVKAMARRVGRTLCTFEVTVKCAGANLYLTPNGASVPRFPSQTAVPIGMQVPSYSICG